MLALFLFCFPICLIHLFIFISFSIIVGLVPGVRR